MKNRLINCIRIKNNNKLNRHSLTNAPCGYMQEHVNFLMAQQPFMKTAKCKSSFFKKRENKDKILPPKMKSL